MVSDLNQYTSFYCVLVPTYCWIFYFLGQCYQPRLLILLSGTVTGFFSLSVTGINQLTSFYFDQESPIFLSGTVTGSLFIFSKMVRYAASVCSSVVPSGLDLFIAQLMNLVETPCLLGQCSRLRLLACFGSRRVPRSAALLPGTAAILALLAYLSSQIHGIAP